MEQQPPTLAAAAAAAGRLRDSQRRGATLLALVADNHVSKMAVRMARALLRPRDELQLVTVVLTEQSVGYGQSLLAPHLDPPEAPCGNTITPVVLVKGDERLADIINAYAAAASADLLVMGTQNLCCAGTREDPLPASGSFVLRLVKAVTCCPVLVVKANTKGPWLRSSNSSMGLKCMVDCQSTSRHMLQWLMDQLDARKDGLWLAASKAHDQATGQVKETTTRMLSNFTVQTAVDSFYSAQRVFKEAAGKALPQAVETDAIDILAVQAPVCKLLPDSLVQLLSDIRSSVLIWRHKAAAGAPGGLRGDAASDAVADASLACDALPTVPVS